MAEPTLAQVFGANSSQTATQLIISKADLATVGLNPSSNNTPESLIVAIILLSKQYLQTSNQESNPDIQITIEDSGFPQIITRNNQRYRQVTFNVNLQKTDEDSEIEPNDY